MYIDVVFPLNTHTYFYIYIFFFNDTATTEIYTLSLHDALPISGGHRGADPRRARLLGAGVRPRPRHARLTPRALPRSADGAHRCRRRAGREQRRGRRAARAERAGARRPGDRIARRAGGDRRFV